MKKKIIILTLLVGITNLSFAQFKSEVNEGVELMSIVFRLADAEEYINNQVDEYTNEIDRYFAQYKKDELISYAKEVRQQQGIGYNAVAPIGTYLEIKDEKVIIKHGLDISKICETDTRWTVESFTKYLNLLNAFYKKTNFRKFYLDQSKLYQLTEDRMNEVLVNFNISWFKTLFKEDIKIPIVIVSPSNGPHNYSFQIPMDNGRNGMIVGSGADKDGLPTFRKQFVFVLAHEFLHPYTNPLIYENWDKIEIASEIIYFHLKQKMLRNAYIGAKTTMAEWFTNLISILYITENHKSEFNELHLINNNENQGFIWMNRSIHFMKHFESDRKNYSKIDDFMSQMVSFIEYTANNFTLVINEYENRNPYVFDTYPVQGGTIKLEDIDTIKIRFSEQMSGTNEIKETENKKLFYLPFMTDQDWEDDKTLTYTIKVEKEKLERGKTYRIKFGKMDFQSARLHPMKEDFTYEFKIK